MVKSKISIIKLIKNIIFPLVGLAIFFLAWFIIAKTINLDLILPPPSTSFSSLIILFKESFFWIAVGNTLLRTIISFSISFICAIIFAVLGYLIKPVSQISSPIISILRSIPTMSIILLSLIWFNNNIAPVVISAIIIFPILYSAFLSSLNEVDKGLIEMSNFFKIPKIRQVFRLYIPSIASSGLSAIQSALSFNVKLIIAAEVLASTTLSMGRYMQVSKIYLDTPELLAWTIMAIALSYFLEIFISILKKIIIRWK